ncbi:MAG: histidine phosphatase family protein [Acidimicrobiales bacterium]
MPSDATRLVLVRHGQSLATVERFAGGERGCRGLSDLGHRQSATLAARIARSGELQETTVLVSSTLPRAIETAEPLSRVLGLPVHQDRDLCEMHPGEGDGMSWDRWEERFGSFDLGAEPDRPLSPGGESWRGFACRVRAALSSLVVEHPGTTIVVATHGGVIEQSMFYGMGRDDGTAPGTHLAMVVNTSLTEWRVGAADGWRLVRYNDAAHLRPDGTPYD